MGYEIGEWEAEFTPVASISDTAKFTYLDPNTGKAGYTLEGDLACLGTTCDQGTNVPLKLTLKNGTIVQGLCGYGAENQAETTGLYIGFSDIGLSDPPNGWDTAMLGN